ncbi:MAG: TrbG/VirB9 family P-type conjugative transfer protein [Plesiomonas shigelloides]
MKYSYIAGAILIGMATAANAASVGIGSHLDNRIQRTSYNANDVTKVLVKKGTVSLVQFDDGENIESIGLGDPEAWDVSVKGSHIFFRPTVDDNPDTNVAVLTNKRNYSLYLQSTRGTPTYILRFNYPKPIKPLAVTEKKIPCNSGGKINGKYFVKGDMRISPYQIWDDGQFTCMRWSNANDLPMVYRANAEGKEMLVNTHMENNTMVIHEVSKNFVIRLGQSVLDVRTDSMTPRYFNYKGSSTNEYRQEKVDAK